MACSGSFLLVPWWGLPLPFFCAVGSGVYLPLPPPSLRWCMHWSVNGVTNWTADRAVACCCLVCGQGRCPSFVRFVVYVHAWAGGPSSWVGVTFWLIRLGGCASRFSAMRGVRAGPRGCWGASPGVGLPGVPCASVPRVGVWRVELSFGPWRFLRAGRCGRGEKGLCLAAAGLVTGALAGGGRGRGLLRRECGGCRPLACVVSFGLLG